MEAISLKQLKDNVAAFYQEGVFDCDKQFEQLPLFKAPANAFEIVSKNDGSQQKLLMPCAGQYSILFRGQSKDFSPCVPTLYRGNYTVADIFVERLKLAVLIELLDSHPVVKEVFIKNHWKVDYEGLAQHYGLKTAMLDFTSDIDVALFFAMCPYNPQTDSYESVTTENNTGVIFSISPIQMAMFGSTIPNLFSHKIEVIGLQPFERPALQRGFALKMSEGEDLQAWKCHFTFTKADSEEYLKKYDDGKELWCNDILVNKVKEIKNLTSFTPQHFRRAFELAALRGFSKTKIRAMLQEKNILITNKASYPVFSINEKQNIIDNWNNFGEQKFFSRIVTRRMITLNDSETNEQGEKRGYIKEEKPNIDINHISHIELLRTIQTGRLAPDGFEARRPYSSV